MKVGNVSQTVLKRSVLKQLHTRREEIPFPPSVEEMCTVMHMESEQEAVFASASVFGSSKSVGNYAVVKAVLDLETRGAHAVGISVQVILPPYAYESRLKEMFRCMEEKCAQLNIQITCAKAEVSPAVSQAFVSVMAAGVLERRKFISCQGAEAGQDIVLCGYAGLEGMLRILDEQEDELTKRFVPVFIRQMKNLQNEMTSIQAVRAAARSGVTAMQQIGSGGIFAALWEMTEAAGIGIQVDLSRISIRQETVEVCEYYHLNPYQMTSAGSILMITEKGNELVRILEESGARASVLGVTTRGNARVITSGEEMRYLDRPQPDELTRWWEQKTRCQ